MAMIHILRPVNAQGQRIEDDVEETALLRKDSTIDNEDEHTTIVEYCLVGCMGRAHQTGIPDSPAHFCDQHVHRSGHVTLKKWPEPVGVVAQPLV